MQQATKQPAVLLVHDYYQVPGGEDVVVANEKHLLETHGHAAALYARRNEEISRMGALEKIRSALGMFFSIRTYREVRRSIRENRISLVHVHNTLPLIGPAVYYAAFREGVPVVQTVHNFRLLCPNALFYRDGHICEDCTKKGLHWRGEAPLLPRQPPADGALRAQHTFAPCPQNVQPPALHHPDGLQPSEAAGA